MDLTFDNLILLVLGAVILVFMMALGYIFQLSTESAVDQACFVSVAAREQALRLTGPNDRLEDLPGCFTRIIEFEEDDSERERRNVLSEWVHWCDYSFGGPITFNVLAHEGVMCHVCAIIKDPYDREISDLENTFSKSFSPQPDTLGIEDTLEVTEDIAIIQLQTADAESFIDYAFVKYGLGMLNRRRAYNHTSATIIRPYIQEELMALGCTQLTPRRIDE